MFILKNKPVQDIAMTDRLFFTDDTLTAQVDVLTCTAHEDGFAVTLRATPFHPQGGGQPSDTGRIGDSDVVKVLQQPDGIVHYVKQAIALGSAQAEVDAQRRQLNARLHSAGHLIGVCGEHSGWVPTKAHHWPGECRVSFVPSETSQPLDAQTIESTLEQWIRDDLSRITQVDAEQRIIGFGDLPSYPCGGTHVRSLAALKAVSIVSVTLKKGVLAVRYHLD